MEAMQCYRPSTFLCDDVPMNVTSISILFAEPEKLNRIPYASFA
jgi:hypothetical protein